MKKINKLIIAVLLLAYSFSHAQQTAKYVFLFIGDGMGDNQILATELYLASLGGENVYEPLSFSKFPVQSFMTTHSTDKLITDSAASATAMATGNKTNNGMVSIDPVLKTSFETIAQKAKKNGYKVGILSSVTIDHATPASFYAHQEKRGDYHKIALQLPLSDFDYFAGGGFKDIGLRSDKNSVISKLDQYGYKYITTAKEINNLKKGDTKIVAVSPGTYSGKEFYWEIDKKENHMPLSFLTKKGIELLDNEKGFFMMIEGGKIDWASHANDIASSIHETIAFDDAVKEAIKFYNNNKEETLIIVTADHETGGLGLGNNLIKDLKLGLLQNQKISIQEFDIKLKELKKKKEEVTFNEVLDLVKENFGLGDKAKGLELSEVEKKWLLEAFESEFTTLKDVKYNQNYLDILNKNSFVLRVVKVLNNKAGIAWTTKKHTGNRVPVRVIGAGQEKFKAAIDNTDIAKLIMKVMQLSN